VRKLEDRKEIERSRAHGGEVVEKDFCLEDNLNS
jgi:hypothetical protein